MEEESRQVFESVGEYVEAQLTGQFGSWGWGKEERSNAGKAGRGENPCV